MKTREPDVVLMESMRRLLENPDFQRFGQLLRDYQETHCSTCAHTVLTDPAEIAAHNVSVGMLKMCELALRLPQILIDEEEQIRNERDVEERKPPALNRRAPHA